MKTTKQDVATAVANILLRLGKNDLEGTRAQFGKAIEIFECWCEDRPERERIMEQPPVIPDSQRFQ